MRINLSIFGNIWAEAFDIELDPSFPSALGFGVYKGTYYPIKGDPIPFSGIEHQRQDGWRVLIQKILEKIND